MGWVGGDGILCALPFSVGVVGVLLHWVDLSAGDFVRVVVPGGLYEGENGGVGGDLSGDGIDAAVLADGVRGVSELCGIGAVDFECGVVDHVAGGGLGLRPDGVVYEPRCGVGGGLFWVVEVVAVGEIYGVAAGGGWDLFGYGGGVGGGVGEGAASR